LIQIKPTRRLAAEPLITLVFRATTLSAASDKGRCNAFASRAHPDVALGASVARITGMAFGWIGSTTASAVVKNL
jgi:hypothetical protein